MATSQLALAGSLAAAPQGTTALRAASSYAPSALSLGAAPSAARATQQAGPRRLAARSMAKELYFNKDRTTMKRLQVGPRPPARPARREAPALGPVPLPASPSSATPGTPFTFCGPGHPLLDSQAASWGLPRTCLPCLRLYASGFQASARAVRHGV